MRLIFIRHGDPDYSIDSLTEKGWREAELLSKRVCAWNVDKFYCSPLGRAKDTASCTLKKLNRSATEYRFLREFEGHVVNPATGYDHICWDFMPDYWTEMEDMYDRDSWALSDLMKTSTNDINKEWTDVCKGIDGILEEFGYIRENRYYRVDESNPKKDSTVVIFCHFGVTMVMMSHLLGISAPVMLHGFFLPPTSVTILNTEERVPGTAYFRCQVMGDVTHLRVGHEPASASGYFAEIMQEDIDVM